MVDWTAPDPCSAYTITTSLGPMLSMSKKFSETDQGSRTHSPTVIAFFSPIVHRHACTDGQPSCLGYLRPVVAMMK